MIALTRKARADVNAALQDVVDHATDARDANDLAAIKRQLNEVWHAVHHAHATVTAAENEARAAALAKPERKVA